MTKTKRVDLHHQPPLTSEEVKAGSLRGKIEFFYPELKLSVWAEDKERADAKALRLANRFTNPTNAPINKYLVSSRAK
jgi:hypothetical protein